MTDTRDNVELQLGEDIAGFYSDPLGFVKYGYPWGQPGLLEQHTGPDEWQSAFLIELGKQVQDRHFDGIHPVAPIRMVVVSGHGVGKSVLCAWVCHWIMSTRPMAQGSVTANTYNQLSTKTWAAFKPGPACSSIATGSRSPATPCTFAG